MFRPSQRSLQLKKQTPPLSASTGRQVTEYLTIAFLKEEACRWRVCRKCLDISPFMSSHFFHFRFAGTEQYWLITLTFFRMGGNTSLWAFCSSDGSWTLSNCRPVTFGSLSSPSNGVASPTSAFIDGFRLLQKQFDEKVAKLHFRALWEREFMAFVTFTSAKSCTLCRAVT